MSYQKFEHDEYEEFEEEIERENAAEDLEQEVDPQLREMLQQERAGLDEHGLVFSGGRQERRFVTESLREFFEDEWFRRILFKVKGGKEATVYCCRGEGEAAAAAGVSLIAAKVYRPRMFRAMHNDWFYKQGRASRDREGKAVYRGKDLRVARRETRIGRAIDMASWCQWEYDTLLAMHEAGLDVPRPLAHATHAILMQYVGDENGAAGILHGVSLDHRHARDLFERIMWNIETALHHNRIHADLSAHNILWWEGKAVIIDWPQAVDPQSHPDAFALLRRDVERVCHYFSRQGVEAEAGRIVEELWQRFVRGADLKPGSHTV